MIVPAADLQGLKRRFSERERRRKELAARAQLMQTSAKRAMFAVHRDDLADAERLLDEVAVLRREGEEICLEDPSLAEEGVWRAAQEERLEGELLFCIVGGGPAPRLADEEPERFLGACSDVMGEMVRVLVREVTLGRFARVEPFRLLAQEILAFLLEFDATGAGRQKVDQARQHLRKIEDVAYDLALRRTL